MITMIMTTNHDRDAQGHIASPQLDSGEHDTLLADGNNKQKHALQTHPNAIGKRIVRDTTIGKMSVYPY
ncbi:MAG: hypothetical protein AAF035_11670 [Pseudomonadota bacterium]